jgi:hypothetical protein
VEGVRGVTEVVKRVEEVLGKAETICSLANEIYYAMKDIQKFVAEKRNIGGEPDWSLLDVLVMRAFQNAAQIARDMKDVKETIEKLVEVAKNG